MVIYSRGDSFTLVVKVARLKVLVGWLPHHKGTISQPN